MIMFTVMPQCGDAMFMLTYEMPGPLLVVLVQVALKRVCFLPVCLPSVADERRKYGHCQCADGDAVTAVTGNVSSTDATAACPSVCQWVADKSAKLIYWTRTA